MDTIDTDVSVPSRNLAHALANALHGMDFDASERAFKKLQWGSKLDYDHTAGTVTVRFMSGEAFVTLMLEDLLRDPPSVTYHGDGQVTLA